VFEEGTRSHKYNQQNEDCDSHYRQNFHPRRPPFGFLQSPVGTLRPLP
jgi:hypothetical protein